VDGHLSISVYLNALENAYLTLKQKFQKKYRKDINYHSFDYFCFHTPFSKMVQKSFLHLILTDIIHYQDKPIFPKQLCEEVARNNFANDRKTQDLILKHFKAEWQDKCERTLLLAKRLGNTYTGSLFNGLASIICDPDVSIEGKTISMFSYGSGCAASLFVVRAEGDLTGLRQGTAFKQRLDGRVKLSAEEYDMLMARREEMYGKCNYKPDVRGAGITLLDPHRFAAGGHVLSDVRG